jgi:hypothetical protein
MSHAADIFGCSPPLAIGSSDISVLSRFKEQALSVVWRRGHLPELSRAVDSVLIKYPDRIKALDGQRMLIKFETAGRLLLETDPDEARKNHALGMDVHERRTSVERLFPEAASASLASDLEELMITSRTLFPDARQYFLKFWTITKDPNIPFHFDARTTIGANYTEAATELVPVGAITETGNEVGLRILRCHNPEQIRSLARNDVGIFKSDLPHRNATSPTHGRLRFWAGVSVYG